jgi:hypothetical protein
MTYFARPTVSYQFVNYDIVMMANRIYFVVSGFNALDTTILIVQATLTRVYLCQCGLIRIRCATRIAVDDKLS